MAGLAVKAHPTTRFPLRAARTDDGAVDVSRTAEGVIYVRQGKSLPAYPDRLTERLVHWATVAPERPYLAQRDSTGAWQRLGYAQVLDRVRRLAQALIDRGLSAERPVLILSGNDLDHAQLALACYHAGIPYAPIAPAYSTVSQDFGKLRDIVALLKPGLVFAADGAAFASAIRTVVPADTPVLVSRHPPDDRAVEMFEDLLQTAASEAVDAAFAGVGPDTVAKYLFTSGTTGSPKAVINTQRMLCSNQAMVLHSYAFLSDEPPVVLDWAPWNHTAAGNKTFGLVLYNGGTFYIDDGRPTPAGIALTARNIRDVSPTWYFNVPKGYDDLVPFLERDPDLRTAFFRRLKMMMYAGAGLAQHTWSSLDRMAGETTGEHILLCTGLGSTETAPFSLMCMTEQDIAGNVGIPAAGVTLKLVPIDGKYEARLKGPNITPGYLGEPELTAEAFDDEGFYKLGDALRFADPDDANKGFYFDGRIKENFKLQTGTWVAVGALRARLIDHFGTILRDAVFAGPDRPFIGTLAFPNMEACRALATDAISDADVLASPQVRARFATLLRDFAKSGTGSSTVVRAMLLMAEPPSIDRGEITDKGSLNQRAILQNRTSLVDELYETGSDRVIAL